jgi:hypothetical protein
MANLQLTTVSSGSFSITSGGITASDTPWTKFSGSSFGTFTYQQFPNLNTGYFGYFSTDTFTPGYSKHQGVVKVQGLIGMYPNSDATYGGSGSQLAITPGSMSYETIYTLPTGYRPLSNQLFSAVTGGSSGTYSMPWPNSKTGLARGVYGPDAIIVCTDGKIRWFGSGARNATYVALNFEYIAA